jgi:transcriptional regulator with PAS, ATPase and Fis domain
VKDFTETSEVATTEDRLAPRPQLFLMMQASRPLLPTVRIALDNVEEVLIGRGPERKVEKKAEGRTRRVIITSPDSMMSREHVKLMRLQGKWLASDSSSKNGTLHNGEALSKAVLTDRDVIEAGETFLLFRDQAPSSMEDPAIISAHELRPKLPELTSFSWSFGHSVDQVTRASKTNVAMVLLGESGTGKEVIARAIHQLSQRNGAFIAVNCGAIPDNLVESELFGARRGAFSGATEDRTGLVRAADKGTLFLDEIGDLPLPSQVAFLRVLQQREVVAVGDTRPTRVDFKLIAATHRDLQQLVDEEKFRSDLYARMSGITLRLPPLRERPEDLGILISTLLHRIAGDEATKISFQPRALRALLRHMYPLNVRELEKALEAAVALAEEGVIEKRHLPGSIGGRTESRLPSIEDELSDEPLSPEDEQVKEKLVAALQEHQGNISAVARVMGKARMQIHRWVRRFAIDLDQFR